MLTVQLNILNSINIKYVYVGQQGEIYFCVQVLNIIWCCIIRNYDITLILVIST